MQQPESDFVTFLYALKDEWVRIMTGSLPVAISAAIPQSRRWLQRKFGSWFFVALPLAGFVWAAYGAWMTEHHQRLAAVHDSSIPKQRRLTKEEQTFLVEQIAPLSKRRIEIYAIPGSSESEIYRKDVSKVFSEVGWSPIERLGSPPLVVFQNALRWHTGDDVGAELKNILSGGGIGVDGFAVDDIPEGVVRLYLGEGLS